MPSGGYGLNDDDRKMLEQFLKHEDIKEMWFEWVWAYVSARGTGATPAEASTAAYIEWDL